ncbi:MAG: dinitrogenase iron-molybdenum cofactor [bacterium]|nr:dinitrogenase iron-molybdenum cofactor [bacterium]
MKIAIATDSNMVSAHFGRCSEYSIYEVEDKVVISDSRVETPPHQPGLLPKFLNEKGVSHVICGGMGPKAQNLFKELNIEPIIGVSGEIDTVLKIFLAGNLKTGASLCTHGQDGHHTCNH